MARVGVIVAAAGDGRRMGGMEKLFADLTGRPLLAWSVDMFESCPDVACIVIAMNERTIVSGRALARERGWRKCRFCIGGARRQDSVASALSVMDEVDCVLVHDGDRPFVTAGMIERGVVLMEKVDVAVAGVPVKDTIKIVDQMDNVCTTPSRESLRLVQTPQVLRIEAMRAAYRDLADDVTDDATLAERAGFPVRVYEGSYDNIKITTPEDLVLARAIARQWGEVQ